MQKKIVPDEIKIHPAVQIVCIFFSVVCLSYFFYFSATRYYSFDRPVTEINVQDVTQKRVPVKVHLKIQDFIKTDINNGAATMSLLMHFTYTKNKITRDDLSVFFFKRALIRNKEHVGHFETATEATDIWQVVGEFTFDLDYSFFPLNDHMLNVFLCTLNPSIEFMADAQKFLFMDLPSDLNGWRVVKDKSALSHALILSTVPDEAVISQVQCNIALNKTGFRSALSLLLPMCILLFIALFALSMNSGVAVPLTISLLLALNAFRIVLENMSPKTSYILMSDVIFLFILCMTTMIFFIQACIEWFSLRMRYCIMFAVYFALIALFYGYLRYWIWA